MKGAVIIGSTGLIGQEISRLLSKEYFTIGTSRNGNSICDYTISIEDLSLQSCEYVVQQINIKEVHVDLIIYIPGLGYNESLITPNVIREMELLNINAPVYLAMAFQNVKFVYFSSCAVLGTTGTLGLETYSATKRLAEYKLNNICSRLVIVRPSVIPDTPFIEKSHITLTNSKGFMKSKSVAQYVVSNLKTQKLILPGFHSKMLHILNNINPHLSQKFLKL